MLVLSCCFSLTVLGNNDILVGCTDEVLLGVWIVVKAFDDDNIVMINIEDARIILAVCWLKIFQNESPV